MLIHVPNPNYVSNAETMILKPARGYELPIIIVDPMAFTPDDEELLALLAEYPPKTKFRRGDIGMLIGDIPTRMREKLDSIPRFWEVKFVISKWAREVMLTLHSRIDIVGPDHLRDIITSHGGLPEWRYERPVFYCVGYPHGKNSNTACFIDEANLKRVNYRNPIQEWPDTIQEAGAEFYGYDVEKMVKPYSFAYAPDDYSHGVSLKHPFRHEEATVQTMCVAGLEEHLFDNIVVGRKRNLRRLDPENPIWTPPETEVVPKTKDKNR